MPVLNTTPTTPPPLNKGGVGNPSRCYSPTPPPSAAAGRGGRQHLRPAGEHANPDAMKHLWQCVIIQAIRDALMDREKMTGTDLANRHAAIAWLDYANEDFRQVCEMAGFNPERISKWWKKNKHTLDRTKSIAEMAAGMSLE